MLKSGDINQFKQLSQFKSLKDFNNQIEQWMLDVKGKFSKGELVALKRLVRYGKDVAGVIYAKIATIVAATHEHDGVGVSRSTFKRMLTKAKEVGLLVIHHTIKKNGKQGHSVYVFNRYVSDKIIQNFSISTQAEPPKDEQLNHPITNNLLESSNNKNNNNIRTESVKSSNKSTNQSSDVPDVGKSINLMPNWVDKEFARLSSYYFQINDTVELWRIATIHSKINKLPSKSMSHVAVEGLKSLVYKIKHGKSKVKNIRGFYNGIMKKISKRERVNSLFLEVFAV